MTSLNAEKYLRGLPLKNDREMSERYAALSAEMTGMAETSRRVFHICCDGLFPLTLPLCLLPRSVLPV